MLIWALPRSLATTEGIILYFLFLLLLRCFNSQRVSSFDYVFIDMIIED